MDILDGLHKYVPSIRTIQQFEDPAEDPSGEPEVTDIELDHFCQILIGGDQVTAARVRGSQSIRRNSDNGRMRLDAFIPVVEDWHTKMCFMQVTWVHLLHLNYISVCVPIQFIVQVIWSHFLNSGCRYSLPTSDPHQQKKCY